MPGLKTLHQVNQAARSLATRYDSSTEHELSLFVPTTETLQALAAETAEALRRLQPVPKREGSIERVLAHQLQDTLEVFAARLEDDVAFPQRYVGKISGRLTSLLGMDERPAAERAEVLLSTLSQAPALLEAAGKLASQVAADRRGLFLQALDSLSGQLAKLPVQAGTALDTVAAERVAPLAHSLSGVIHELGAWLKAQPEPAPGAATPSLAYAATLSRLYGIQLSELLDWHRQEVELCHREFLAFARQLDANRAPGDILVEDSPPYPTADEMYPAIHGFLDIARAKTLEYMELPRGEVCRVKQVPEHLRHSYPWGGYWGGNTLRGDLYGAVFLNRYNYREITRAWIQMNAVHESYPGHHVQAVRTAAADMPDCFKLGGLTSRGAPLAEGIAHRSESLCRGIFGEPVYELFVLYRRLHTAVRIWADLELFHLGGGVEAAVSLYREYLGFADQVARGQVLAQRLTPGYFTIYYYGMRYLERLQAESGWGDRPFTDLIFGCGRVSLAMLRELMALEEADRIALTTGYSRLVGTGR